MDVEKSNVKIAQNELNNIFTVHAKEVSLKKTDLKNMKRDSTSITDPKMLLQLKQKMDAKTEEIQAAETKISDQNNKLGIRQTKLEESEIKLAEKMTVLDSSEKKLQGKLVTYEECKAQLETDAQNL